MNDVTSLAVNELEAARMLGVSVAALRRWRRERRGPPFTRLGRCIRYVLRDLDNFLIENTIDTKKERKTLVKSLYQMGNPQEGITADSRSEKPIKEVLPHVSSERARTVRPRMDRHQ